MNQEEARANAMRRYGRGTGRSINFTKRMLGLFIILIGVAIIYGGIQDTLGIDGLYLIIAGVIIILLGLWRLFKKYPKDYGIGY